MTDQNTKGRDHTEIADANLARLAVRDLERTMDQLIEVDGRALSLASRAGQMFLDGKIPESRQEELVHTMEQVVNASLESRKMIKEVSRMVSVTKAAASTADAMAGDAKAGDTKAGDAKAGDQAETRPDTQSPGEQQRLAAKRQMRLTKMRL